MDPHEPFLKAILANRHEIALETTDPTLPLYAEMKALEARVLDYYLEEWQHELPESMWYLDDVLRVVWRRGFPDDLGPLTVGDFLDYGAPAIVSLPLTALHLEDFNDEVVFEAHPELGQLSRLKLGPNFGSLFSTSEKPTLTFDSLMSVPVFTALRHLDLSENRLTDAWIVRFAFSFPTASFAPTLESLDLSRNFDISDAGANVLATAPGLDVLKRLIVRDTGITKSGLAMLRKRFGDRLE
jgi:hypothetical protein